MQCVVVYEDANRALRGQEMRHMLKHMAQMFLRIGMLAQAATAGRAFRRAARWWEDIGS